MSSTALLRSPRPAAAAPPKAPFDSRIEGLRGVAALLVALEHLWFLGLLYPVELISPLFRNLFAGHAAVLVFFVLSGYVIGLTNPLPFTTQRARAYLGRRALRLLPIYWIALGLTIAVGADPLKIYAATALLVDNLNPYGPWFLPPPIANVAMWSLHYEVVYYLLFLVLWRWPRLFLPSLVGAFVVSIAGWVLPPAACPRFLAGYASGWIFWGLGWWLSRQPRHESAGSSPPLLAGIFLLVATERLGCGNLLLHGLGFPQADISMVNLSNLVFLPCCLMLVAGAARLDLKLLPAATWLALLIPLGAAVAIVGTGRFGRVQSWTIGMAFTGLAWVAARWKSGDWLKRFAPLGRISYAFYLVHLPLLWALAGLGLSAVRPVGFVLSASAWFALAWGLAAALELRLQPRLRQWWQRRAAHS